MVRMILCACGCGKEIAELDCKGRLRKYSHGHHARGRKPKKYTYPDDSSLVALIADLGSIVLVARELNMPFAPLRSYIRNRSILISTYNDNKRRAPAPELSEEWRRRHREGVRRGAAHPFWKGGITAENKRIRASLEYRAWREAVFERDDYTCQICGTRGGRLHPDHIKRFSKFPELRFDINNGRTLCESCHKQTPTYGRRKACESVI